MLYTHFTTSHFISIRRQQIYVSTSQHILYSIRSRTLLALLHVFFFPICARFFSNFESCVKNPDASHKTNPSKPPGSLSSPVSLSLMAFLSLIYTLWHLFRSCHQSHSYSLMTLLALTISLLFFCDTMAAVFFFFFLMHFFLNRYTYKHHCIYASQDLNIQCSELSIDIFFQLSFSFFFIYISISHVVWIVLANSLFNNCILPRFVPLSYLCISSIFTFAFFSIRLFIWGLRAPYDSSYDIKAFYFTAAARDL